MSKELRGVTTNDIEYIQVQLNLKDGRVLLGVSAHPIIKNIMAQHVKFAEVKPELIHDSKLKDIVK